MAAEGLVTGVIINYKTPDLLRRAVTSLIQYYPELPLLLIDNGSDYQSTTLLHDFRERRPHTVRLILNTRNLHHGPSMDQALRELSTPFVFFLDSDCLVTHGDFIERMQGRLQEEDHHYAIGKRISMDHRGFDVKESTNESIPYIRPLCMMLKRELYLALPPFELHGTPCLENMREASKRGLTLLDFPVDQFVAHEGRGTAGRFGYKLGWKGRVNYLLHKLGM